jgi:phage gpG-like protein
MSLKVKNLETVLNKIKTALEALPEGAYLLEELAIMTRDRIFDITKSGYTLGFNTERKQKLKGLAWLTKRLRKWHQDKGLRTGSRFSPGKSNLTYTGQMLDAMDYSSNSRMQRFKIFVPETARKEVGSGPKHKRNEENLNNAQVAKRVAKDGRPFLGIDRQGRQNIVNRVKRELRTVIRKNRLSK